MKPYRYRTAAESAQPGYLAKRFRAYSRLERLKAAAEERRLAEEALSTVTPLRKVTK